MSDKNDALINTVYEKLNKTFKDSHQKTYLLNTPESPTSVKHWISTGCTPLNIAISNRPNGGVPSGKITQFNGLQSTGKSLILANVLAQAQKAGGVAVLIDNEFAVDVTFMEAIGLDTSKLIYSNLEYIEDILTAIEEISLMVREKDPNCPLVIGVDSVAGAKTREDTSSDFGKSGYNTHKAIILSQKLPRIVSDVARLNTTLVFTQQLRTRLGVTFGDPYTSASGGMALDFYSSVIVRLKKKGKIKNDSLVVGVAGNAVVTKNRLGPPYRQAEFEIYFDSGIDDAKSCLDILKHYKVVKTSGAWTEWKEDLKLPGVNPDKKFQTNDWRTWMEDPAFYDQVANKIAELSVMRYKGHMGDEDNVIVSEEDEIEESPSTNDGSKKKEILENMEKNNKKK